MAETDVKEAREGKVCPPQVLDLVDHLRTTGTGQAKLDRITELGKVTKDLDEFLSMLPNNIPALTLQKVDEYIGKIVAEKQEKVSGKKLKEAWLLTKKGKALQKRAKEDADRAEGKGDTVVQTRDESQSSIPEKTVLVESKAPVLKPEGSAHSKQLGADVEVPADSVPKSPEDEEATSRAAGDEEDKSEVADMNVDEAKDAVSRMRSREKLQNISRTDKRKGVKDAVEQRLQELEGNEEE